MLKKIVIIGPESTGKSTLSAQLATYYGTSWCPEFAREYLLKNGPQYTYEDLLPIAKGQLALEDQFAQAQLNSAKPNGPLFIDTDMYVMKVWGEFVFDRCHKFILDQIAARHYDGYLLCDIDLPWEPDQLREHPDLASRQRLFNIYKDLLVNQSTPWAEIGGNYDERLAAAIRATDHFLAG
ncbi:MAG: ATPase [Sphingobacteriales bacterium SCN 48-20]|uniref:ATP-binding protein n=1 Tax=Terrimonas ferruginea TaxID=249 RepID=UPI00086A6BB6|nr:ATP-binding protein [Terrimonas ferruginea]MBN8783483.1 ATP-binding protein [Terrimonas ferruginea]ODT92006.1 MAG: ATPase [Sphingobacteriales bacterium SCN 48-20]OJW40404.1 MAG: ATPase [Sphingobacteriales bacterium 48-107]